MRKNFLYSGVVGLALSFPFVFADDFNPQNSSGEQKDEKKDLKESIKFRKEQKKKDLSYTDCIGYIYAARNNMKFLTGDKEFEGMKNVEFVK